MKEEQIIDKYSATMCALNSYKSVGFFTREYAIMQSEKILQEVIEEYEKADKNEKNNLEDKVKATKLLTYRELFEKMFLCLEDLSAIVTALTHPLEDLHEWVSKSPNVKTTLEKITDEKIYQILKYKSVENYDVEEIQIVNKYRNNIIKSIKHYFSVLLKFYKINEKAYIRMKHGNSLFYSLQTTKINNQETFVIPVSYNLKTINQVDVLLLSEEIYNKTNYLFRYTQDFLRCLCNINIDFISQGCIYHPIGLIHDVESDEDKKIIEEINRKYTPNNITKYDINTNIILNYNKSKIDNIIKFYDSIQNN